MDINKFNKELVDYAKQSGAFEWAAKQYYANRNDEKLKDAFLTTYSMLDKVYYPQIVEISIIIQVILMQFLYMI